MRRLLFVVPLLWLLAATPARATPAEYEKYTVVRTENGRPEQLPEVAQRVLGDRDRYLEIFTLNRGRAEPDGATVTDPQKLRAGWVLALPFDATGDGVSYGTVPVVNATDSPWSVEHQSTPDGTDCVTPSGRTVSGLPWAQLRLAPESAWSRGKGADATVAVLDSGVSASVPALSGRVLSGADVTTHERADSDCTGHGTALAGVVAAAAQTGVKFVGIAPESTILPVRVKNGTAAQLSAGLQAASAAGAGVALIGVPVDLSDEAVIAALRTAVASDLLVVLAAPAAAASPSASSSSGGFAVVGGSAVQPPSGVLRVGAVGPDGKLTEVYTPRAVDVVAPGSDIVTLARTGSGQVRVSGTEFAAAFVAGTAALLRADEPGLTPAQAADRIETSADSSASASAQEYGHGLIDIASTVKARPAEATDLAPSGGSVIALVVVGLLLVAFLLGLRFRR